VFTHHHYHQNTWAAEAVAPIPFAGNVYVRLQGPVLGGRRLRSHHQSDAAKSALPSVQSSLELFTDSALTTISGKLFHVAEQTISAWGANDLFVHMFWAQSFEVM